MMSKKTKVKDLPRKAQKAFWAKVKGKYDKIRSSKPRTGDNRVTMAAVRKKMMHRSNRSKATDMGRTAQIVLNPRSNMLHVWMENPEMVDVEGVDTKGSSLDDIRKKLRRAVRREQKATRKDVEDIKKREEELERERQRQRPDQRKVKKATKEIRKQVRSGLRRRQKAYFDIGRYKKQMAKEIANKGPMTYLKVVHLVNLAPREYDRPVDTIDWYANIDPTLSYGENKAILERELQKSGGFSPEEMSKQELDWMEEKYEAQWRDYVREYAGQEADMMRLAARNPERYFEETYGRPPTTEQDKAEVKALHEDAWEYIRTARTEGVDV
jgi:hypothetical protein